MEHASHYCIDSRLVRKGSLFFALKGERADGTDFLREAAAKGAAGGVVSKGYAGEDFGLELMRVDDVLQVLQSMARRKMAHYAGKVIGITGSVGKTTTKEFLATLLEKRFSLFKSPLSYNSQRTLPINILNAGGDEDLFILEMAMSQKGEIARLVDIAPPDLAIVTKIGRSHTTFFPDGMEGVAEAKGEILESPKLTVALIDHEAMRYEAIRERGACEKVTFGDEEAEYSLMREGELVRVVERGRVSPPFSLPFTATHLSANFLVAAAAARLLGMEWEEIGERAKELRPVQGRFETVVKEGIVFVNDSYNASLESTRAALQNLPAPHTGGKRFFVFGEMRELGDLSHESHAEVGRVAAECVDHVLCLGEGCRPTLDVLGARGRRVDLARTFDELKALLFRSVGKGDVVLIKGANSHRLWRLLE